MTIKTQLTQHAIQLGNAFKGKVFDLEKEQLDLQLKLKEKEAQSEAASMAFERSHNFAPTLGPDFACPECWVRHGRQVAIVPIPSETNDDLFRCRECETHFTIHN